MDDPDLIVRQQTLAAWLRENLHGHAPSREIHESCGLYGPDDLDGCVDDLTVLADADIITDAPGSAGPLGHRWRVIAYVAMAVTVCLPVSNADHEQLVETLRDVIDVPAADIGYQRAPSQILIRVTAAGGGMFGGLQAAHEILAVVHEAVRADCADPGDANLMALRSFLEAAYDIDVQVNATSRPIAREKGASS